MDREELVERTRAFALRIIKLVASPPNNRLGDVLGRQILKSGTSIGANYREMGQIKNAVRYFELALELDPGIDFARDNIEKLKKDRKQ